MRAGPEAAHSAGPVIGSPFALAAVLLTALASLLPLGLIGTDAGYVAHLALAPLFMTAIAERDRSGPVAAFAAGLIVDALTLGPLGVCAAAYLAFHGIAAREAAALRELPLAMKWLFFVLLAGAVAGVHVMAMLLVGGAEPPHAGLLVSAAVTCLAYPALSCASGLYARRRKRAVSAFTS